MSQLQVKTGRPTDYSDDIAERICALVIQGWSVRKIGMRDDMPCEDTIYTWLAKHDDFSEKYREACEHRTTKFMDECVDLADTLPDGVMFLDIAGQLHERDAVLALSVKERAEAGLVAIGLSTELIAKRRLQIKTRMDTAERMNPRKYGPKQTLMGDADNPIPLTGAFEVRLVRSKESSED